MVKSHRFIYLNDDFSFSSPVCMSDFWTPKRGYKVYQNRALSRKIFKKKCPEECEWRMSDGNCDQDCNLLACLWDGDDCSRDGIAPDGGENLRSGLFILTEGT